MSKAKKPAKKPAKKKVVAKAKPAVKKQAKAKVAPKAAKAAKAKAKPIKPAKPVKAVKAKKAAVVAAKPAKPAKPAKAVAAPKPEPAAKTKLKAKGKGKETAPSKPAPVEEAVTEIEPTEPEITEEIVLTDAEGRRYCRVKDCDQLATVDTYCRYHYLLYWKRIQVRKKILTEGKLERYIEELTARYPDKFLDMLRKDLKSEKEFVAAIQELEIDESAGDGDFENEEETFIDEVRGMQEAPSTTEEDF